MQTAVTLGTPSSFYLFVTIAFAGRRVFSGRRVRYCRMNSYVHTCAEKIRRKSAFSCIYLRASVREKLKIYRYTYIDIGGLVKK